MLRMESVWGFGCGLDGDVYEALCSFMYSDRTFVTVPRKITSSTLQVLSRRIFRAKQIIGYTHPSIAHYTRNHMALVPYHPNNHLTRIPETK